MSSALLSQLRSTTDFFQLLHLLQAYYGERLKQNCHPCMYPYIRKEPNVKVGAWVKEFHYPKVPEDCVATIVLPFEDSDQCANAMGQIQITVGDLNKSAHEIFAEILAFEPKYEDMVEPFKFLPHHVQLTRQTLDMLDKAVSDLEYEKDQSKGRRGPRGWIIPTKTQSIPQLLSTLSELHKEFEQLIRLYKALHDTMNPIKVQVLISMQDYYSQSQTFYKECTQKDRVE